MGRVARDDLAVNAPREALHAEAYAEVSCMGSVSLILSLDRFIEAHERTLVAELVEALPASVRGRRPTVELVNDGRRIEAYASWVLDDGTVEHLELPSIDPYAAAAIDAERFDDDCRMGW
jgi:hypothetical protein